MRNEKKHIVGSCAGRRPEQEQIFSKKLCDPTICFFRSDLRGMTMIEAIVWVAVFTSAMLAISSALLSFYRANAYAIQQAQATISAQHGIDTTVKTIREAAYSSQGAFPIVSIAANDFVFYADTDSDSLIEKVHYFLQGTSFVQGIVDATSDPPVYTSTEATSTLSDYVRNADASVNTQVFHYYDKNGTEITDYTQWAKVRFVTVTLVANVDQNHLPNQQTIGSSAAIRNLMGQ